MIQVDPYYCSRYSGSGYSYSLWIDGDVMHGWMQPLFTSCWGRSLPCFPDSALQDLPFSFLLLIVFISPRRIGFFFLPSSLTFELCC
jgi:hypothetical protein